MAQLKDLIVAGSARLLGKTYFEDTVTIKDTLEVDAIKADNIITPNLNSDGTALAVGGNINLKGRLTTAGITSSSDISPSTMAGSGMTLGTTSKYWKRLYVGDGTAGGVSDGAIMVSGGIRTTSDIALAGENKDLSLHFINSIAGKNGYDWRIRYVGTGSGDANYLSFESNKDTGTYEPALRLGLTSLDAIFGGNIYPMTAFGKHIGSTTNPWANVYAKGHYIYNNNKTQSGGIYVQTDGTTSTQGESYIVVGNATASGSAGNSRGSIFLYSSSAGYTRLIPGTNNDQSYTLYLPGASGQLVYHTNDTAIGGPTAPVYVDSGGKITACNIAVPGNWWGALTSINANGIMKVGKYLDFHTTKTGTSDYDYRLEASTNNLKGSGALEASTSIKAGTFISAGTSISAGTTMTVGTNLTVKGTTTLGDAEGDTVSIVGNTTFSNDVIINKTLTVNGNGALATGSTATALSGMTGHIKVLNGGIVTNKDVAADNFYVKDKVRIKYDSTNDYLYFVFN